MPFHTDTSGSQDNGVWGDDAAAASGILPCSSSGNIHIFPSVISWRFFGTFLFFLFCGTVFGDTRRGLVLPFIVCFCDWHFVLCLLLLGTFLKRLIQMVALPINKFNNLVDHFKTFFESNYDIEYIYFTCWKSEWMPLCLIFRVLNIKQGCWLLK